MTDLSTTIAPKSDQINADDLIGGRTMTITVTKVTKSETPDQPISIHFEGDNGKPYKPCKSMRRVMVHIWGADGNQYIGRSMTIYRDDNVKFGGADVGGIRISHMSDMPHNKPATLALTASKANRKPYTVKPLQMASVPKEAQFPYTNRNNETIMLPNLDVWVQTFKKYVAAAGQTAVNANMNNVIKICEMMPEAEARINPIIASIQPPTV